MTGGRIRFVDRRSWSQRGEDQGTALKDKPEPPVGTAEEPNTLPVPEHLHRLWLALGLDDE